MSGSHSASAGADPSVMVRMWAVEGVQKSRKASGGGAIINMNDAVNVIVAAAVLEDYVLNGIGAVVQAKEGGGS